MISISLRPFPRSDKGTEANKNDHHKMQFCAPRPQLSEGGLSAQLQHFQTGAMEAVGNAGNAMTILESAFEVLDFHIMFS